jgi:spore coat polysaccharide biosynthesis protein SpsF
MTTLAVIAARTGSSRMPGKVLQPILGKPMLERMIERVRQSRYVDDIVIATSTLQEDERLVDFARAVGVNVFRGSPDDVLGRMHGAVSEHGPDLVVELLGDNPLVHADLIDDTVDRHQEGRFGYTATVTNEYPLAPAGAAKFPIGIRVQVFPPAMLARCEAEARTPAHREHSTSFIAQHPERFGVGYLEARGRWADLHRPDLTFAVNYKENHELVAAIFERCYPEDTNFSLHAAVRAWDENPVWHPLMGTPV